MEFRKRQIGQWTLQINFTLGMEREADWLLSYLEKIHQEGVIFSNDMKLELGWSMLHFRCEEGGLLVVNEPDFSKNPFVDVRPDLSVTLQVLASQIAFTNQLRISPLEVSFQDKVIFAKGCMDAEKIYLERIPPRSDKGDSGWFIGYVDGNNEPENLQSCFVYQLLYLRPMLLQLLLLPAGYMVVLDGSTLEAILDQDGKSISMDSIR